MATEKEATTIIQLLSYELNSATIYKLTPAITTNKNENKTKIQQRLLTLKSWKLNLTSV